MFFDDDKKAVTTILSKRHSKGGAPSIATAMKPEIAKTEDGAVDGRHVAMQDFMAGHKEGSAMKMADALKNFMDLHKSMTESEESE